jgi:cytochrome c oxidase cbb3-type subunit III
MQKNPNPAIFVFPGSFQRPNPTVSMRSCPAPIRLSRLLAMVIGCLFALPSIAAGTSWTAEGLFVKHCAACHGERGDGQSRARSGLNPPPRSFTSEQARAELDRDRMIRSVTEGRPNTAMVGWEGRLSHEQITAIVDYIRVRFMRVAEAAPVTQADAAGQPSGRDIYTQNCVPCHGDLGRGATWTMSSLNPPPRDFTREVLPRERMVDSVTNGRPGTAMMAFATRLSAAEIGAVVDFIRSEFMPAGIAPPASSPGTPHPAPAARVPEHPAALAATDMTLPFPGGLRGDAVRGGDFYMENCHVCHGRDGDGRGPRSSFIQPAPRDFLSEESRRALNRPALYKAISAGMRGTVMPAWRTVLSEQEIADVAEFVFQAYIEPDDERPAVLESAKKKAVN